MFMPPELREGAYYNVSRNSNRVAAPGEDKPKNKVLLFVKSLNDKDVTYEFVDSVTGETYGKPLKESRGLWGKVSEDFQLSLNTKYLKSALTVILSRLKKD